MKDLKTIITKKSQSIEGLTIVGLGLRGSRLRHSEGMLNLLKGFSKPALTTERHSASSTSSHSSGSSLAESCAKKRKILHMNVVNMGPDQDVVAKEQDNKPAPRSPTGR